MRNARCAPRQSCKETTIDYSHSLSIRIPNRIPCTCVHQLAARHHTVDRRIGLDLGQTVARLGVPQSNETAAACGHQALFGDRHATHPALVRIVQRLLRAVIEWEIRL